MGASTTRAEAGNWDEISPGRVTLGSVPNSGWEAGQYNSAPLVRSRENFWVKNETESDKRMTEGAIHKGVER